MVKEDVTSMIYSTEESAGHAVAGSTDVLKAKEKSRAFSLA